ncbi:hypothetical protein GR200_31085 [Rhizobium leguminosarum]|uniref:hypothetical protein n=1 Tax=Rhizobium leguminosarum TaxID=384 RepID=UPI0013BB6B21|nr:hypothetical protein [Rhizobium leguminosarum]NEI59475.1 hypothetical protein [Rhizobium leguminosarum]NEI88315.1 hypothetical protein [Rhizobium leguminosarum]
MKSRLLTIALSALFGTAVNAAEDEALPPYFAPLIAGQGGEIEACYTAILARDGLDSPACSSTRWLILFTHKKAKVAARDYQDMTGFKEIISKLTQARNGGRVYVQSPAQTQQVIDNIGTVVGVARSELKDDKVSHCLADIRYNNDPSNLYCDYALAVINLTLSALTERPAIKMRRDDLAAVLE